MRHNIFRLLTEEQANELLRDKTEAEIKELIYGFNKKIAEEIKEDKR